MMNSTVDIYTVVNIERWKGLTAGTIEILVERGGGFRRTCSGCCVMITFVEETNDDDDDVRSVKAAGLKLECGKLGRLSPIIYL